MPDNTLDSGSGGSTTLHVDISEPLARIARRDRRLKIVHALLKAILAGLIISLVVVLIMGSSPLMPLALRWVIALAAWAGIVAITVRLLRPTLVEMNLQSAANMVEKSEPEHEERIVSAVEFSLNPPPVEHTSPELVRHVIMQAREHTGRINFETVLSSNTIIRWIAYCAPAILVWAIIWPLFPQTVTTGVRRIFAPWSAAMGSGATLRVTPGNVTLGQGADLEIIGKAKPPLGGKPVQSMTLSLTNSTGAQRLVNMTPIGPGQFRTDLKDVESTFQYQIIAGNADSACYHARVIARPRISELELRYTFPTYTALQKQNVTGQDGSIKAIIGTQVQLIVHASEPLATTSSVAMNTSITGVLQHLPLTNVEGLEYQATFPVQYTTSYRIDLLNADGIKNNDDHAWPIIAIPDLPPVIHILNPAARLPVRVDDVIPITFDASDDFGLSGVRAIVTIGQSAPMSYAIVLGVINPRQVQRQWNLSVADQLQAADQPRAKAIFYRFEAIDNCEPAHQKTRSGLHELIIDRGLQQSYQQRMDTQAYKNLTQSLTQAQQRIEQDQHHIQDLQRAPIHHKLTADQQRLADQVQQNLAQTVDNLKSAAKAAQISTFAQPAEEAAAVAKKNLPQAANQVASATFADPKQPQQRQDNLAAAQRNLQQTQQALNQIQQKMAEQANAQKLADNLTTLAKRQQEIAQIMTQDPGSSRAKAEQQQVHSQLTNLLKNNKSLQTPVAAKVQPTMSNLKDQLAKILASQQNINNSLQQQMQAKSARQGLTQLAQRQQRLNDKIQQLEKSVKAANQTKPNLPAAPMMNAVVGNLRQNAAKAALAGQHEISNRLQQAAGQMKQTAGPEASQQRQAHNVALNNQRKLSDINHQANAQNTANPRQQLKAMQHEAQSINQLAQKMLNHDHPSPEVATQLHAAMAQAQQALQAASNQNARQTQAALQRASNLLNQAVQNQVATTKPTTADSGRLQQLARQAEHLARQQQQLADKTAHLLNQQHPATAQNAIQQAQTAQQISGQIKQAADLAKEMEQQTQSGAPDLNADVAQARRQMQAGNQSQQSAAQAIQQANTAAALEHQQSALQHIRIAMDDLNGALHSPEMQDVPQYNDLIAGQVQAQAKPSGKPASGQQTNKAQTNPQSQPTGLNSYQRAMAAAQQVQNAIQAQQQAGNGNPQSAQQAAQALGAAGKAMDTRGASPGAQSPVAGTSLAMGQTPGKAPGQASGQSNGMPGIAGHGTSNNPGGITSASASQGIPPKPVLALGISPAQWRNLGPMTQHQLLNSARQNIPVGYRRMVRDYYIQLSEMHSH